MPQSAIIFYSLLIIINVIGLCITAVFFGLLRIRRTLVKTDRISYLLIANSYIAFLVACPFFIEMSIKSIYGQLHPESDFSGWECIFKAFISQMTGCTYFYSFLLQSIFRFARILHPNRLLARSFRLYILLSIFQWIAAAIVVAFTLSLGYLTYLPSEFHCQFALSNFEASLVGSSIHFMIPLVITLGIYFITMHHVRKKTNGLVLLQNQIHVRRDFIILTRLIAVLTFVSIVAIPQIMATISYAITQHMPSWIVGFTWFFTFFSFSTACIIQMFASSHHRKLWAPAKPIHPMTQQNITRH